MRKWRVFVRIDGSVYNILGSWVTFMENNSTFPGIPFANITNTVATPTQVILITQAGPLQVNLTFINPVEVCFLSSASCDPTSTYAFP
jgi:hypothetical protein